MGDVGKVLLLHHFQSIVEVEHDVLAVRDDVNADLWGKVAETSEGGQDGADFPGRWRLPHVQGDLASDSNP